MTIHVAAPVEFEIPDGPVLRGQRLGSGPDWAVLLHDLGGDLDGWAPLAGTLAGSGMSTLAIDLRGHGGSDGDPDPEGVCEDLRAALGFAREQGAVRVYIVAAGLVASLVAAHAAAEEEARAVVLLSPLLASGREPPECRLPRLVVLGRGDPGTPMAAALRRAPGWMVVVHVPADRFGLRLLEEPTASDVESAVLAFLSDQRRRT